MAKRAKASLFVGKIAFLKGFSRPGAAAAARGLEPQAKPGSHKRGFAPSFLHRALVSGRERRESPRSCTSFASELMARRVLDADGQLRVSGCSFVAL